MNRIYAVESGAGLLGAMADHRLALKPSATRAFLLDLAKALGVLPGSPASDYGGFLPALVEDLERGGLLLPGVHLTPAAQALAMAVNARLKAPVAYVPPLEAEPATPRAFPRGGSGFPPRLGGGRPPAGPRGQGLRRGPLPLPEGGAP